MLSIDWLTFRFSGFIIVIFDITVIRNEKIVWKHGQFYIEISMVSWNLTNTPNHRGSFLQNMASSD